MYYLIVTSLFIPSAGPRVTGKFLDQESENTIGLCRFFQAYEIFPLGVTVTEGTGLDTAISATG